MIRRGYAKHRAIGVACEVSSILLALSAPAHAQDVDSFALSPEQLFDASVISASKTPEKLMDAPAAIYVLSSEDIRRSGATSIPEALRLVPGVQVAQVNANSWAISVRGFNGTLSDKLLVLIDGREVYDPLFSGVYWDVQDTMLEDIDRIEVVRGPGGTLWGDNAVNGVINIITKKAEDTQGNLATSLSGNQERNVTEIRHGGTLGDNGYWRAYGKYTDTDDEPRLTAGTDHDGQIARRGGWRADWRGDGSDSFTLQGDAYTSEAGQFRFLPVVSSGTNPLTAEDIDAHGGNVMGRWTRSYAEDSRLTVQTYLDYVYREQLLLKDQRTSFDLDAQYELPQDGRHKFIVGGRYRLSADNLTGTPDVTFSNIRSRDQILSGFVQDKITLDPKTWFLTLGSKLEYNTYSGVEVQPSARLQWHPDAQQMLWASVSRAVRTPSRLEQDLNIVQAAAIVAGPSLATINTLPNPNFESERLVAYELGYRRQLTHAASVDVSTFYNTYDRLETYEFGGFLPGSDPTHTIVALVPFNATTAQTEGVETTASWRALDNWNLSASVSLLNMQLHGPASVSGAQDPEGQSPSHQFNLHSQWDVTKDVAFDTTFYYVGGLVNYSVRSYTRLDTRLGWRITDRIQFDLVGQNLLDPSHQEFTLPNDAHVLATEIGRSIYGKITWRF